MNKFEAGKTYQARSICDNRCLFEIKVISRSEKTITCIHKGERRRFHVHTDSEGEYIQPERYSMAPIFRACQETDSDGE